MLVLIVDDHPDAGELLSAVLRHEGYETAVAHDGPTALKLSQQQPPDVVLLDLNLPAMDGYEVASKLRSEVGFKGKIITVSGCSADHTLQATFGVDHHLVKPVRLPALFAML